MRLLRRCLLPLRVIPNSVLGVLKDSVLRWPGFLCVRQRGATDGQLV
jgi:hypothetical protein